MDTFNFNGTLYGVVMKKVGEDETKDTSWYPIYGDDIEGYKVANNSSINGVNELICPRGTIRVF